MSTRTLRFRVGSFECIAISDGSLPVDAGYLKQFFAGAGPGELVPALRKHGLDPDGIRLNCTCLLIDTGAHKVLVDDGAGPGLDPNLGHFLAGLEAEGIAPRDIDRVILSHGHWDHVCGSADEAGRPIFPNARYVMPRRGWTRWAKEYPIPEGDEGRNMRAVRRNLLAIQDRLDPVDPPAAVVPGVSIFPTPGHTPDHVSVAVESEGAQLLSVVDTMDLPVHVEHVDWYPEWDEDGRQAVATRRALLTRAADQNALIHGFHFPFPGVGRVRREGDSFRFEPLAGAEG